MPGDTLNIDIASATAAKLQNKDIALNDINSGSVRVRRKGERTDVEANGIKAKSGQIRDNRLDNVTADQLNVTDLPNSVELTAKNVRAGRVNAEGARIDDIYSPEITAMDTGGELRIFSDDVRVASIDAGSAVLGSLNIAGVRLTIRQGRVEGTTNDIDAGTVTLTKSPSLPAGGQLEAVRIVKPVFILEPSGRYRASADMSLGGGIVGSVPLGAANAKVVVDNDAARLNELTAVVMDGTVTGNAVVAFNCAGQFSDQCRFFFG